MIGNLMMNQTNNSNPINEIKVFLKLLKNSSSIF